MTYIDKNTPASEMTIGGNIYDAGNAREFKTGDWRSVKPVYIPEKCIQCGLCFPVCPEDAIPVGKTRREQILITIIVKDAEFAQRFVLLGLLLCMSKAKNKQSL